MRVTETVEPIVGGISAAAFEAFAPGDTLNGRYELRAKLGSGGSSVVYAAWDRQLRCDVAVKVLRADRFDATHLERLRREATVGRDAPPAHLVRVFDLDWCEELPFLTMELMSRSLGDLLATGPLPIGDAVRYGAEVAEGLADLHAREVIHRDIKPGNILLDDAGHARVADFGIVRFADGSTRLTETGNVVGTRDYLAPEALAQPADKRTDLYSLGVVLFEMLTGELPESTTLHGRPRRRHLLAQLRRHRPQTPAWLAAIVARLLEKESSDRYTHAAEVATALRGGRRPFLLRRGLVMAMAAVVTLFAGIALWLLQLHDAPHIVADGDRGVRALSRSGTVLWTRKDVRRPTEIVLVHRRLWERPLFATVLNPSGTDFDPNRHTLTFLDPRTGRALSSAHLRDGAGEFPNFSKTFGLACLFAADLDGDGVDEIAISYTHAPLFPSYTVVYDFRRGESRPIFVASGHHMVSAAMDVDGDGHRELLLAGINNKMGWNNAIAAVRVRFDRPAALAGAPDGYVVNGSPSALAWYALLPPGDLRFPDRITADPGHARLTLEYLHSPQTLDRYGFPLVPRVNVDPTIRTRARENAYIALQEAIRLESGRFYGDALRQIELAGQFAAAAHDGVLSDWTGRVHARLLVAVGETGRGEEEFRRLMARAAAPANVAWDAGTAFHALDDLDRALAWFHTAYGTGGDENLGGRRKHELLEPIVFARIERQQWSEALAECTIFEKMYPSQATTIPWYRLFIQWRQGLTPPSLPVLNGPPDTFRYWAAEARLARGEDPATLLRFVDEQTPLMTEALVLMRALRGELLARTGHYQEGLNAEREAVATARQEAQSDPRIRVHLEIVEARLRRLESMKGPRA